MTKPSVKIRIVARAAVFLAAALVFGLSACDNPAGGNEASDYTVTFDSRGGAAVPSQTVPAGGTVANPGTLARDGHTFGGWRLSPGGGAWNFASDTVTANITLYAAWTAREYAVSFDSRGGGSVPGQTVAYGDRIAAPDPAPVNGSQTLEGWYRDYGYANKWDFDVDTVAGAVTLYARWVAVPPGHFLVTFNVRGGSAVASQIVAANGKVQEPEAPTRNGYVFDAWHKEAAAANVWDFDSDTITATTILYAGWTPVWTVAFNTQQGSTVSPIAGVIDGSLITKPAEDPERAGYSFGGWHKEAAGTNAWDFAADTVAGNTTLYAKWIRLHTVTFNSGDGSDVAGLEAVLDGALIAEPTAPALANCAFEGWYKEAAYANKWDFDADTVAADTVLYARWTVTVAFNANGGSAAPASQTLTRGGLAAEPETEPVNAGKTFMGWHREAAGTTAWIFTTDRASVNTTLYAKWEFVPVTGIVNVPVDGILRAPDLGVLDLGAAAVDPPNASVKTIGWTLKSAGTTGAVLAGNKVTATAIGTVTLTATVTGGIASGNYTDEFTIPITTIRKVTGIGGLPETVAAGDTLDLNKAAALPSNATNKTIGWTLTTAGAGVAAIGADKKLALTGVGTLALTATIVDGHEDAAGNLSDYTEVFSFTVDSAGAGGGASLGDDTSVRLYANGAAEPLPTNGTVTIAKGAEYYVSIDAGYSNIVWRLNGRVSSVTDWTIYLDTKAAGTLGVTVEAETGGLKDGGAYTFIIK
jgi:uncharacterized repeat protein (TIGR02543 family)